MEILVNHQLVYARNQRLETERLLLRPVTVADAPAMYAYASDPETVAYVFPLNKTLRESEEAIAEFFMKEPLGKYGIEKKEEGLLIGTLDLRINKEFNVAEIGYVLNRSYWGQGIMPEAAAELMRLGFEELKLLRIFGRYDIKNPNSGRVMEKLGMKVEGTIPGSRMHNGVAVTDIMRGITAEEWQKFQKEKTGR